MIIEDGTGKRNALKVDEKNRAHTFSTSQTKISSISHSEQQAYVLSSGFIEIIEADGFSAILYIKNTDTLLRDLYIQHLRVCSTEAATDPCHIKCELIRNPTGGTIVSNASAGYSSNSNFGSSNTFSGLVYKGASGVTVTGGSHFTQFINHSPGHSTQDYNDSIIIPAGSSIALQVEPCDTLKVCCEFNVHFE